MPCFYRVLDHTSDIGVLTRGKNLPELFNNAARALFDLMIDMKSVEPKQERQIAVEATSVDLLLREWLAELLYCFHGEQLLFSEFDIEHLNSTYLKGIARGEQFVPGRHTIKRELKSITYHQLEVIHEKNGYKAQYIIDV